MRLYRTLALSIVLISLLVVTLPSAVAGADETVYFPDPKLEAIIRSAIGITAGEIKASDVQSISRLTAISEGITDIRGLEHCTGLTDLVLGFNEISDITPLAQLTNLS